MAFAVLLARTQNELAAESLRLLLIAPEQHVQLYADDIARFGIVGIPYLLDGLASDNESIVLACRNTILRQKDTWIFLPTDEANAYYLTFVKKADERLVALGPTAKNVIANLAEYILLEMIQERPGAGEKPLSFPNRAAIVQYCQSISDKMLYEKKMQLRPHDIESLHFPAIGGEPTNAPFVAAAVPEILPPDEYRIPFDPHSTERADKLFSLHESYKWQQRKKTIPILSQQNEIVLSGTETDELEIPEPVYALPEQKIASNYQLSEADLSDKALDEHIQRRSKQRNDARSVPLEETTLGTTPPSEFSALASSELMKLLQHPDPMKADAAKKLLAERDCFTDAHIQLALRVYNKDAKIRADTASLLSDNPTINSAPWLLILTQDSDAEVRYAAYSLIATSNDLNWVFSMMQRAKYDESDKIVALAFSILR